MAEKIEKSTMHDFVDGEFVGEAQLDQNFEVARVAINDVSAKVDDLDVKSTSLQTQVSDLSFVANDRSTRIREKFYASEGQDTFTLMKGEYIPGEDMIDVWVEDVHQFDYIEEIDSKTFKVGAPLNNGDEVYVIYYTAKPPVNAGHANQHAEGGADPLDITTLKGYDDLVESNQQAVQAVNQRVDDVLYKQIADLSLMLDASHRVSGANLIGTNGATVTGMEWKLTAQTAPNPITVGTINIILDDVSQIKINNEFTLLDDTNIERVNVTAVNTSTNTVTISPATTKAFKAGAFFTKSSTIRSAFEGMYVGNWTNPNVTFPQRQFEVEGNPAPNHNIPTNNAMVMMDNGDMYVLTTRVWDWKTCYFHITRVDAGGTLDPDGGNVFNIDTEESASTVNSEGCGMVNLGGVYLGVYYFIKKVFYFTIINTFTREMKHHQINGVPGSTNAHGVLSNDKKYVYIVSYTTFIKIELLENMGIKSSVEGGIYQDYVDSPTWNFTECKVFDWRGYIHIITRYWNHIRIHYKKPDVQQWTSYIIYSQTGGREYPIESMSIMKDERDYVWIGFTESKDRKPKLMRSKGTFPLSMESVQIMDSSATHHTNVELADAGDTIRVYYTKYDSTSSDVWYQAVNKVSKQMVGSKTAVGVSCITGKDSKKRKGFRLVQEGFKADTRTAPSGILPIVYVFAANSVYMKMNYVGRQPVKVLESDARFKMTGVKDIALYVIAEHTAMTVNAYIGGNAMTKVTNGVETQFTYSFPEKTGEVELRFALKRTFTTNTGKFIKIYGGFS
jgi:hypothetical protein